MHSFDRRNFLKAISAAKTSQDWQKDEGQYIPYPGTWLNARGWEDEYTSSVTQLNEFDKLTKRRTFWEQIPEEWKSAQAPKFADILTLEERERYLEGAFSS